MTAAVRVSRPYRGWLRFVWRSASAVTPYQRELLDKIEQLPGASLQGLQLEIPHTLWRDGRVSALIAVACDEDPRSIVIGRYDEAPVFIGARKFFPWQTAGVEKALESEALLLADEMGLGKTTTALAAAERFIALNGVYERPRYIVAPQYALSVWRRELLACGLIDDPSELCVLRTKDHRAECWNPDAKWYFIHYEVAPYWASRLSMHPRGKPSIAIVDEIHRLRDPQGKQAKAVLLIVGGALFRMGLTGTPIDRPRDLYMPLTLVTGSRTWGHFGAFRERYCGAIPNGYGLEDGQPSHVQELQDRIEPYYLRRTMQTSGIQLPPLMRKQVAAFLTDAQREQHAKALGPRLGPDSINELVAAILESRAGRQTFAILHKARKITSKAKFKTTCELLQGFYDAGESVVLFVYERETAEAFREQFAGLHGSNLILSIPWIRAVHGGIDENVRVNEVAQFQQLGGCLVATYGALREGVTLTKARHVVLHDLDWNPSVVLQAEARVYRIGQERPTFSHWVVTEDSVDTLFARVLLAKAEMNNKMLDLGEALRAVEEVGLSSIAPDRFNASDWARDMLSSWRPR